MIQQQHDQRSLYIHRYLVGKVRNDPDRYAPKIRHLLSYWKNIKSPNSLPYVFGWEQKLNSGLENFLQFSIGETEESVSYRQPSPLGVVFDSPKERLRVMFRYGLTSIQNFENI